MFSKFQEFFGRILGGSVPSGETGVNGQGGSVNSGLPKDLHLAFLVRILNKLAVLYNFRYAARHLPGKDNAAADALSRLNVARFKRLMPDADSQATEVPNDLIMSLILGKSKRHCNSLSETLSH